MISRFETFQRMLGLKGGQFRRTGVTGGNIVVGVVLGVLSGKYIFEEPIQRYWAEKHAADAAAAAAAPAGTISSSSSSGKRELNTNITTAVAWTKDYYNNESGRNEMDDSF